MTAPMVIPERLPGLTPGLVRALHAAVFLLALICVQALLAEEPARKVVAKTAPSYPELARKMHATGKVRVEAVVAPSGSVTSAKLVGGSPVFEKSAVDAVKQWKFESGPKETKTVVVLEFAEE
jgi:TonB family protein